MLPSGMHTSRPARRWARACRAPCRRCATPPTTSDRNRRPGHRSAQAAATTNPGIAMTNLSAVGTLPENTEAPNVPKSRKSMLVKALSATAAIAVGLYGVHWWNVGRFIEDTDDAYVGGDVTVIAPRVSGYIAQVAVHDNQRVRAGDLLFRIDDRELRAALAKAEGAVAAQEALLANLDATTHLQDAVVRQARASIDVAAAEGVRSKDDQARYAVLAGQQLVSLESAQRADAT